jgi:hypothetical protein
LNHPWEEKGQIPLKCNTHQKINNMKGGKKEKYLVKRPLTYPVNSKKYSLKKEEEKSNPDDLPQNHQEKMGAISHLPHEPNPYEEAKKF